LTPFKDLTRISVTIQQVELTSLAQRVALDFGSHSGEYHVIYVDPYQVMAPPRDGFTDLKTFMDDGDLPTVPKGLGDFIPIQLDAAGRFEDRLLALLYDAPTMVWCYRKDLFEKYGDKMKKDVGFDPMPSDDSTWERYYGIAKGFNENQDDVPYGAGQQAKQHDALMCDFSNLLRAYGGDYFENGQEVGTLGTTDPGPSTLDSPAGAISCGSVRRPSLKTACSPRPRRGWNRS
jgi:multiple sugar transport system substrate-binding protein